MASDTPRQPQDGTRTNSPRAVGTSSVVPPRPRTAFPTVNPFHLAIAELQADRETTEEWLQPDEIEAPPALSPAPAPISPPTATIREPATMPAPAAEAPRPATVRSSGIGGLIPWALVSVACGLLGGYGYDQYLRPTNPAVAAPGTPGDDGTSADDLKVVSARTERTAHELDGVVRRLDELPPPSPRVDLSELRGQIADLSQSMKTAAPLSGRVKQLDGRAEELSRSLDRLRNEVAALKATIRKPVEPPASAPTPEKPVATRTPADLVPIPPLTVPPPKEETPESQALARGADLLKQGKFKEALGVFNKLELKNADDARVWYYSALAHGLATDQWGGGTESRALKGIEREQAGTPAAALIDDAFRDLPIDRGKGWLERFRERLKTK